MSNSSIWNISKRSLLIFLLITSCLLVSVAEATNSFDNSILHSGKQPIRVFLDGQLIVLDAPPILVQARTLVPMRAIFEAFGAEVHWSHESQTVHSVKGNTQIRIQRNSTTAWVNDRAVPLDVFARTVNGRMMVPLRFLSESLGMDVQWSEREQRIDLYSKMTVDASLSFGLKPPRPVSFTTEPFFIDSVPAVYYNLVLKPNQQEGIGSFRVRVQVEKPDGSLLVDRVDHNITVSADTKELHMHGMLQMKGAEQNLPGNIDIRRWDHGDYRVHIWLDDQKLISSSFVMVPGFNELGNTSGNILNAGLVARQGDRIYYAGEDGSLHKRMINSSEVVRLTEDRVQYINTQGAWVYFVNVSKSHVISRMRFDGRADPMSNIPYYMYRGEAETLSHDEAGQLLLVDDWLYYVNVSDGRYLYRMRLDGTQKQLVLKKPIHQFYMQANQLMYISYINSYEDQYRRGTKPYEDPNIIVRPNAHEQAVGYLYVAPMEGAYRASVGMSGSPMIENSYQVYDQLIMNMAVVDNWIYYMSPIEGVSWESRVSGRVRANLNRIELPSVGMLQAARNAPITNTMNLRVEKLLEDTSVVNYYVDSEVLLVQSDQNRGRVWHRLTPDGVFVNDISTQVMRKSYGGVDNVALHERTTFPVTYMNRAYQWVYYYVGNEDELITDQIPLRNDERIVLR